MSVSRHHADWLSLVESSGPFLSLPVLMRVFPQGLDPREPEQAKQLRLAYEEWQDNPNFAGKQRAWIIYVLTQGLGYPQELLAEGQALPPGLSAQMAEYGEILRPDIALLGPAGNDLAGKPQLLISIYPANQALNKPVAGKHWKAEPGTRMMELLHAADVPLGLVTNGEQWMLVFAPRGETTGFTSWYAYLWTDEPITLRAFLSLLCARRFFGVAASDTLSGLLTESAQDQQEVTNQLGEQVRDAVEVLIQDFDRLDQDSGHMLLKGIEEKNLYDAALTVMMRLVFLFSAEERGLLHLGKPIYDENYAVSTLREQLQEVADHYGEEVLERRNDAWARLLATFRAVHAGVSHQDLMLPTYGGSLFDPDRYPFLEGRPRGSRWATKPAEPLEINNRVVLHLLKSLQMLQVRVPGGGPAEARRISFRALDIEQIGHIYEGLLDHTAVRAKEVVLGLAASRKKPVASIALAELEKLQQEDEAKLVEALEEATGKQAKSLQKALKNEGEPEDFHKVLIACAQDQKLAERVVQFSGLLRQDSFERPVIVLAGGIYVGQGNARRSTGTHYTPRSLTEPIVQHTLEPLVYLGPAEGLAKEQWKLKSPKEILDLKVCDMAMGSGAFLVQACRYLSERLVESWENLEKEHPGEVLITPQGQFSKGEPSERLIPKEAAERLAISRRLVADRCIYGVDINPMAVEMAKLSIWLITVDKSRPFTFLDHALKCGDSLLGICRFKQLETFSLDEENAKQVIILSNYDDLIRTAIAKRRELEMLSSNDAEQIAAKQALMEAADESLERLNLAADLLIAAELAEGKEQKKEMARAAAHLKVTQYINQRIAEFRAFAQEQLEDRRTFHWPLAFPEIFEDGGFHAITGNPPFMGGQKITGALGTKYRDYLVMRLANGKRGSADLCAYFFLRAFLLLRSDGGTAGLLATNTVSQGDTREVGLDQIVESKKAAAIIRAVPSKVWPGEAALEVAHVWLYRGKWQGTYVLDGRTVAWITSFLTIPSNIEGKPFRLAANQRRSFQGSIVLGMGFVLTIEEAQNLITQNSRNKDVVLPYLNGEDITSRPDQSPSRWVIHFHDWPLQRGAKGRWRLSSEKQQKEWLRAGIVPDDYTAPVASDYPEILSLLERRVKKERLGNPDEGARRLWWRFLRPRVELREALRGLAFAQVCSRVGTHHFFVRTRSTAVFSDRLVVISLDGFADFAVLSTTIHDLWAHRPGQTTHETRNTYFNESAFETFPFPGTTDGLAGIGEQYLEFRKQITLQRSEGLTRIYNRFHDVTERSADINELRRLHANLDMKVASAFGWVELDLNHGFYEQRQGTRFTIHDSAQHTVLDLLLAINHQRYGEEVRAGLHEKTSKFGPGKRGTGKGKLEKGRLL
jgi:hypothetical protein